MALEDNNDVILSDDQILDDGLAVSTDKDDYAPGSTAIFTATGLEEGGSVTFEVEHVSDAGADGVLGTADDVVIDLGGDGHDSWTVTDGGEGDLDGLANGTVVTSWYVNPDDSLDETFLLRASDGAHTAYASFTDGINSKTTVVVVPGDDYLLLDEYNEYGAIGDSWFVQGHVSDPDSSGTGNILPFLRLQDKPTEEGYNSSYRNPNNGEPKVQYDEDTNINWNHDLLLEQVPIVYGIDTDLDGIVDIESDVGYYQFRLDLNESNDAAKNFISLDELQLYLGTEGSYFDFTPDEGFYNGDLTLDSVQVYDMDSAYGGDVYISFKDTESGSGRSDLFFYVSVESVEQALIASGVDPEDVDDYTHLYLYSEFGVNQAAEATFEEWSVSKWASIDLEKYVSVDGGTTWYDADDPTGPQAYQGDDVYFKFTIENTGNVDLDDVTLTDDIFGAILPDGANVVFSGDVDNDGILDFDETWTFEYGPVDAILGQHANLATVTATPTDSGLGEVSDEDPAHYFGLPKVNIYGTKFEDTDGDGAQDDGEDAPSVSFKMGLYIVTDNGDGTETVSELIATDWTDEDGNFSFNDLPLLGENETYRVRELGYDDGGEFVAIDAADSDWVQTTAQPADIDPDSNSDGDYYVSVGNFELASISGVKYEDTDADGTKDAGETTGIDGIEIVLVKGGEIVATTTTADGGKWSFDGLTPGSYSVYEVIDGVWYSTAPTEHNNIVVSSGEDENGYIFLNWAPGSISGTKYYDGADVDTVLSGWEVTLYAADGETPAVDADGAPVAVAYTDSEGNYSFENLKPGTYVVKESVPEGWSATGDVVSHEVTVTSGEAVVDSEETPTDFYNSSSIDIGGVKYEDLDADGSIDDGGATTGVEWTIKIWMDAQEFGEEGYGVLDEFDTYVGEATTDEEDGSWSYELSEFGTYFVEEVIPEGSGWQQSYPAAPGYYTFDVVYDADLDGNPDTFDPGLVIEGVEDQSELDFANWEPGSISGTKYYDGADVDTVLSGWEVTLYEADGVTPAVDADGAPIAVAYTDIYGNYSFENLKPGTYVVKESVPDGWSATGDVVSHEVTVTSGEAVVDSEETPTDFYNSSSIDIGGVKYEDLDADGSIDDGGATTGVEWTIKIWMDAQEEGEEGYGVLDEFDTYVGEATTDEEDGSWSYELSEFGTYFVEEVIPEGSGWQQSYPAAPGYYTFDVVYDADLDGNPDTFDPGLVIEGVEDQSELDFANWAPGKITGFKWEDSDGDASTTDDRSGVAGWTISLYDSEGQLVSQTTTADGQTDVNGDGEIDPVGYYEFSGLNPGDYTVVEGTDEGWYHITADEITVTGLTSRETDSGNDFVNTRYASIEGYKFFDEDRDGTWDEDEKGALGWTIELYLDGDMNGNGILDEGEVADGVLNGEAVMAIDVSGEDGSWSFDGLYMGTYFVKEVMKPGWLQTTPELNGDGVFKVVVDQSGEVVLEAVSADPSSYDELPNDGMLWFGNDMIDGPGVRTPGFWQSYLGQTYWDGIEDNDGIIPGTGNTEEKEGENFAENDVFWLNYEGNYKTDNGEPVLQVGDWNFNTLEDDGGAIREYSMDDALAALQGGESTKGKSSDYAKLSTVERSLVASWLNYMAGNPVDAPAGDGEDVAYWIDQAILYLEYFELNPNNRKIGAEAWKTGLDYDGDGTIDESGSAIQAALDGWNNSGELDGFSVAFDGDNGSDITAQAYYDAVA